jgi:hypothetical protein
LRTRAYRAELKIFSSSLIMTTDGVAIVKVWLPYMYGNVVGVSFGDYLLLRVRAVSSVYRVLHRWIPTLVVLFPF